MGVLVLASVLPRSLPAVALRRPPRPPRRCDLGQARQPRTVEQDPARNLDQDVHEPAREVHFDLLARGPLKRLALAMIPSRHSFRGDIVALRALLDGGVDPSPRLTVCVDL